MYIVHSKQIGITLSKLFVKKKLSKKYKLNPHVSWSAVNSEINVNIERIHIV